MEDTPRPKQKTKPVSKNDQVIEMLNAGASYPEIQKKLGVSPNTIAKIKTIYLSVTIRAGRCYG